MTTPTLSPEKAAVIRTNIRIAAFVFFYFVEYVLQPILWQGFDKVPSPFAIGIWAMTDAFVFEACVSSFFGAKAEDKISFLRAVDYIFCLLLVFLLIFSHALSTQPFTQTVTAANIYPYLERDVSKEILFLISNPFITLMLAYILSGQRILHRYKNRGFPFWWVWLP